MIVVLVVAGSGVKMRIWHSQVSTHVGSNPVGDVGLVHGVLVDFVLARAWHVQVLGPHVRLHTVRELSLLAFLGVGVGGVSKVEVAQDLVLGGSGEFLVLVRVSANASSELDSLRNVGGHVRGVFLGTNGLLQGILVCKCTLSGLDDHKSGNRGLFLGLVSARTRHLEFIFSSASLLRATGVTLERLGDSILEDREGVSSGAWSGLGDLIGDGVVSFCLGDRETVQSTLDEQVTLGLIDVVVGVGARVVFRQIRPLTATIAPRGNLCTFLGSTVLFN